ncbi:type IV secretion system protein VirB3 [Legionella saoudiensis]|uniref:type IV secretion system protein VirB3 n=1 Tax=Legionella saoudiensis TaxID=1750561 RepID=UPI00073135B9|nr:VirB3 family type IV secretion system protein [Legionella saoudiensis]
MQTLNESDENTLFLALTRPAMKLGVTMDAFFINVIIAFCVFALAKNPFWAAVWLPLHVVCAILCRMDIQWFPIFLARKRLVKSGNERIWSGVSYEPY